MSDLIPSTNGSVPTTLPTALNSRPNALALLKALRRRWLLAAFAGVLCAVLAATATWYFFPQKYTALTTVQVPIDFPVVLPYRAPQIDLVNHQRNQISLVKSRLVLNTALKDRRVAELSVVREQTDPLDWLERQLQADFFIAGEILRISITGDRPQELIVLVDSVRDAYLKEFREKEQLAKIERLNTLGQMRQDYEGKLSGRKKERKELEKQGVSRNMTRQEAKIHFVESDLAFAERELGRLREDLSKANLDLAAALEKEKQLAALELPANLSEDTFKNDRVAQQLHREVEKLQEHALASEKQYALGKRAPQVRKLYEELGAKRKELAAHLKDSLRAQSKKEIIDLQTKISVYQTARAEMEKETGRLRQRLEDMQKKTDVFQEIQEDTSVLDGILNKILSEEQALQLDMAAPRRVRILDEGYAKPPSTTTRPMAAGMAGLGGLGLVLLAISWWEFRARRIETVDEVIQGLGLKLVGAIPDLSHRWFGHRRGKEERTQHLFVESIDTTRTVLLEGARAELACRGDDGHTIPQVVMVTSAHGGEGKTSLTTHLAASLAQIGHKTLLIDADLRNPTAHRIIGLSSEPGYCELLRGEVELADVIRSTPIEGLWMITGGRWDNRATRALAQPRTGALIEQLRADFEFILIDSSPVLPVVDPLLLSRHVDIVLLSVLCNVSRMKNVYAACQRLTMVGVRSLRAVMSGVRGQDYDSAYQYYSHADVDG